MSDIDVMRRIAREVNGVLDTGPLAVRILRDVVRALGVDLNHTKVTDLAPAIGALRARVAELEAAQRWIPVGERPSRRTVAVVCRLDEDGWNPMIGVYVAHGPDAGWYINRVKCDHLITHYLPLRHGPEVQP